MDPEDTLQYVPGCTGFRPRPLTLVATVGAACRTRNRDATAQDCIMCRHLHSWLLRLARPAPEPRVETAHLISSVKTQYRRFASSIHASNRYFDASLRAYSRPGNMLR